MSVLVRLLAELSARVNSLEGILGLRVPLDRFLAAIFPFSACQDILDGFALAQSVSHVIQELVHIYRFYKI